MLPLATVSAPLLSTSTLPKSRRRFPKACPAVTCAAVAQTLPALVIFLKLCVFRTKDSLCETKKQPNEYLTCKPTPRILFCK